jgi:hypothetical protein
MATGAVVKNANCFCPVIFRTSEARSGAVLPARLPVHPIRPPTASGRYMCFFCILPCVVSATDAMKGMNIATRAVLFENTDITPALRSIRMRKVFSPCRIQAWQEWIRNLKTHP